MSGQWPCAAEDLNMREQDSVTPALTPIPTPCSSPHVLVRREQNSRPVLALFIFHLFIFIFFFFDGVQSSAEQSGAEDIDNELYDNMRSLQTQPARYGASWNAAAIAASQPNFQSPTHHARTHRERKRLKEKHTDLSNAC